MEDVGTRALPGPDELLTLRQAARLAELSPETLRVLVHVGRLQAVKPGRDLMTTRRWLHRYLASRNAGGPGGRPVALPVSYVVPEGEESIS